MAVQKRNDELVDILKADFVQLNNPSGYWHGHRQIVPAGFTLVIPTDHVLTVADFEVIAGGSLEIAGVLMVIG